MSTGFARKCIFVHMCVCVGREQLLLFEGSHCDMTPQRRKVPTRDIDAVVRCHFVALGLDSTAAVVAIEQKAGFLLAGRRLMCECTNGRRGQRTRSLQEATTSPEVKRRG